MYDESEISISHRYAEQFYYLHKVPFRGDRQNPLFTNKPASHITKLCSIHM